jgi:hypothetical protein
MRRSGTCLAFPGWPLHSCWQDVCAGLFEERLTARGPLDRQAHRVLIMKQSLSPDAPLRAW